jgi:hypothetical protein
MNPAFWSWPAATVTPTRRTPSIMARNSWVIGNSSVLARSCAISSQRARRWSVWWRPLQAAVARHLPEVHQGVAQQQRAEGGQALQRVAERRRADAQGGAGALHHGLEVVALGPEQDGQADEAVAADQPDLGGVAVLQVGHHRGVAGLGEPDVGDGLARRALMLAQEVQRLPADKMLVQRRRLSLLTTALHEARDRASRPYAGGRCRRTAP